MQEVHQKIHDPLFLAWAAGFIDGEGCFFIARREPRAGRSPIFEASLIVTNCELETLYLLRDRFGGFIALTRRGKGNWRSGYQWRLAPQKLRQLLPLLMPHLIVKQKQAVIMEQFLALVLRPDRPNGRGGLPSDEIAAREQLRNALKTLNIRGKQRDEEAGGE